MTLIKHHIRNIKLRADAPFPSEIRDAQQLVRRWRYEQRCKLVRGDGADMHRRLPDSDDDFPLVGE